MRNRSSVSLIFVLMLVACGGAGSPRPDGAIVGGDGGVSGSDDAGGGDGGGAGPLDAAPADIPDVTVEGDVVIKDSLDAKQLDGVTILTGILELRPNSGIKTLTFPTLKHTAGVSITGSSAFTTLRAPWLAQVDGYFLAKNATSFTTLDLPNIESIANLQLESTGLADLSGLAHLTSLPGIVWLDANAFTSLAGLEGALGSTTGEVKITSTPTLTDASALSHLVAPAQLTYYDNGPAPLVLSSLVSTDQIDVQRSQLSSLSVPQLGQIGNLDVIESALTSISFPALVTAQSVAIHSNPSLPACQATAIAAHATGFVNTAGNLGTCP